MNLFNQVIVMLKGSNKRLAQSEQLIVNFNF